MNQEREIDLRDLLYYVLKKWRVIIIAGMIVAVILGTIKCILSESIINGAVIGLIVGIVATSLFFFISAIRSRKMWSTSTWQSVGIPVLGEVRTDQTQRKTARIDSWIENGFGCQTKDQTMGDSIALVSTKVAVALKQKQLPSVAIISKTDNDLYNEIVNGMNKSFPDMFIHIGNILCDAEAVLNIPDNNACVLLADGENITFDEVTEMLTLLSVWGNKFLGVILVK